MANLLPYFNKNLPVIYFIRLFCAKLNIFSILTTRYSQKLVQFKYLRVYERVVFGGQNLTLSYRMMSYWLSGTAYSVPFQLFSISGGNVQVQVFIVT